MRPEIRSWAACTESGSGARRQREEQRIRRDGEQDLFSGRVVALSQEQAGAGQPDGMAESAALPIGRLPDGNGPHHALRRGMYPSA